jgi:hypothetical protein
VAGVTVGGYEIGGTVSIGAGVSHAPVRDIDALINCADGVLYEAKRSGRNRIRTARADAPSLVPAQHAPSMAPAGMLPVAVAAE